MDVSREDLLDVALPVARRLPELRDLMPGEVRLVTADGVADPAAEQVGTGHRHLQGVPSAEVVADDVDGRLES